jgi:hypothetical protein
MLSEWQCVRVCVCVCVCGGGEDAYGEQLLAVFVLHHRLHRLLNEHSLLQILEHSVEVPDVLQYRLERCIRRRQPGQMPP